MINYFLNRWIMSRRFRKSDSGYVYRRRPDLPGIAVTVEERAGVLDSFRRRYWSSAIRVWASFGIGAVAVVLIATSLDLGDLFLSFATYALMAAILGFVLWEHRKLSLLPETMFADRPRLPPELPTIGWLGRFQRLSRDRSWVKYGAFMAAYGPITWFLAPRSIDASAEQWFFFGCFAVSLVMLLYGAIHKAMHPAGNARN